MTDNVQNSKLLKRTSQSVLVMPKKQSRHKTTLSAVHKLPVLSLQTLGNSVIMLLVAAKDSACMCVLYSK